MNVIETIRKRFTELLWSGYTSKNAANTLSGTDADLLYNSLIPGGAPGTWYWGDIDYTDQTRSNWQAAHHYGRILTILKEYGPERLQQESAYAAKMTGALEYWLHYDFLNPNWWHNDIGMPRNIGDILLMMHPVLSRDILNRGSELVGRGSMGTRTDISDIWTGANLIWGTTNTLKHAVLTNDEALLRRAVDRAGQELRISINNGEGIQPDGSFFQHGPRLYSGGYGRSFAYDITQIVYVLQQTQYQFSPEQLDALLSHVLDGLRHMTQGSSLDLACIGREIVRKDDIAVGGLKSAVELMTRISDLPRQEELNAYLDAMNGGPQLRATKYFPNAALLCHHMDGLYVGAKFATNKTWDAEICNSEGELCYNMSYGTHLCIMHDGSEYVNITPIWDYARIPGTTARPETDEQLLTHRDWWCSPLPNSHCGGEQKGNRAAIYELAQHDGVEAYVAHFAFEGGFACLGAGIHADPKGVLVTTVDQCHLQGEVQESGNSVIHHNIRYTGLNDTRIQWEAKTVTGSWRRNDFSADNTPVTGKVLTLYIPQKKDKYAFMISPAKVDAPSVEILRNDTTVQAIRLPDGSIMAVFHEECDLTVDGRVIHKTSGTCIEA